MAVGEENGQRKPAVFLDRDGVLAEEKSYIVSVEDLNIFSYSAECVKKIHEKGYYAIVVTNQSGVARGLFTEEGLQGMNDYLIQQTGVDAVYYCPHHPEGKVIKYRQICHCRKPEAGMIESACREFKIDMEHSYMVGDRAGDILTGKNVGIKTVLVESGYGTERLESAVEADYVLKDLRGVIEIL
ncbi:MAG: HAD family hydrolase [Ruminococcus flavefaciens]|nr:HAD family hydrolase [Ruminococcus flavefaciens]